MTHSADNDALVHWISDAPTSLHGNGAASFEHATRLAQEVTCRLCLSLLRKEKRQAAIDGMVAKGHTPERAEELIDMVAGALFAPGKRFGPSVIPPAMTEDGA